MSAVKKALDNLKFVIPRHVLERTFIQRDINWRQTPMNIDHVIMSCVIRPRVLVDCNLVGGREIMVDVGKCEVEKRNNSVFIIRVPKSETDGGSIITALNLDIANPYNGYLGQTLSVYGGSSIQSAADQVLNAASAVPSVSNAELQLIGENTVMVRNALRFPPNCWMRCRITNDEHMNHIQPTSWLAFAKLVEYAVKAYIYNEQFIAMGQGELSGGQNLGQIKEIIDSYSDANELYETYIKEKWQKIALMNDQQTFHRHIRRHIGSGH